MILPLLETLSESQGKATTGDICEAIAHKLNIPEETRNENVRLPGASSSINLFDRTVRWAQQTAKRMGLIKPAERPYWQLKDKGSEALTKALPGTVFTIFITENGTALWGSCEDAIAYIEDQAVNLLFTSPPYPLRNPRPYGNVPPDKYIDWFLKIAEQWPRIMAKDGSIVLNFGDTYEKGLPHVSLYQERLLIRLHDELGLKLCQKFYWQSPTKLPVPKTFVAVRRVRVKPSVEQIYWLSASDNPYADNRKVLKPYSDKMIRTIAQGGENRHEDHPSGHGIRRGAYAKDNSGAIPGNLIVCPNAESNQQYIRLCKTNDLPIHPARFPWQLPNFFIRFLTHPDDLVYDPCAGSGVTAQEAEKLGRRWLTSETIMEYVQGSKYRFAT